jgi:carbonic anhydrase/acetyltransferase-like protein (isoleucine patch superfamily)
LLRRPLASLRGDFGRIVLEEGANLQDTCVMHGFPTATPWSSAMATSATVPCCMVAGSAPTRWWA